MEEQSGGLCDRKMNVKVKRNVQVYRAMGRSAKVYTLYRALKAHGNKMEASMMDEWKYKA